MEKHKRFLYFKAADFYPNGGLSDLEETFDTISEAVDFIKRNLADRMHLYDRVEGVGIDLELYGINY